MEAAEAAGPGRGRLAFGVVAGEEGHLDEVYLFEL
jgi:hypothetical protein